MRDASGPFTGTWQFNPLLSKLSAAAPPSWVQQISADDTEMSVEETIVGEMAREQWCAFAPNLMGTTTRWTFALIRMDVVAPA